MRFVHLQLVAGFSGGRESHGDLPGIAVPETLRGTAL